MAQAALAQTGLRCACEEPTAAKRESGAAAPRSHEARQRHPRDCAWMLKPLQGDGKRRRSKLQFRAVGCFVWVSLLCNCEIRTMSSSGSRAREVHLLRKLGEDRLKGILALVGGDLDGQLLDRVGLVLDVDLNSHAGGRQRLSPRDRGGPQRDPASNKGAADDAPACGGTQGREVSGA